MAKTIKPRRKVIYKDEPDGVGLVMRCDEAAVQITQFDYGLHTTIGPDRVVLAELQHARDVCDYIQRWIKWREDNSND